LIGEVSKRGVSVSGMTVLSPASPQTTADKSPGSGTGDQKGVSARECWAILSNAEAVSKPAELAAYMTDAGILSAVDLLDSDMEMLIDLSKMLKPVQQKKFQRIMGGIIN
jgi:hypothetical protein